MFKKLSLIFVLCLIVGGLTAQEHTSYYTTLKATIDGWNASTLLADVIKQDRLVTSAAGTDLITPEEFDELDALIRAQYLRKNGSDYIYPVTKYENTTIYENIYVATSDRKNEIVLLEGDIQTTTGGGQFNLMANYTCVFLTENGATYKRNHKGDMFYTNGMGHIIIKGTPEHPLIVDGGASFTGGPEGGYTNGSESAQRRNTGNEANWYVVHMKCNNSENHTSLYTSNVVFQNVSRGGNFNGSTEFGGTNHQPSGACVIFKSSDGTDNCRVNTSCFYKTKFKDNWLNYTNSEVKQYCWGAAIGIQQNITFNEYKLADDTKFKGIIIGHCEFEGNLVKRAGHMEGYDFSERVGGADLGFHSGTDFKAYVAHTTFKSSFCDWYGGSIFWNRSNDNDNLILKDCSFTGCHGYVGGAIYNEGKIEMSGCTFDSNHAMSSNTTNPNYYPGNGYEGCGGAVFSRPSNNGDQLMSGVLNLDNCTFTNNVADIDGGAVLGYVDYSVSHESGNVTFDCEFTNGTVMSGNQAGRCGGGLALVISDRLLTDMNLSHPKYPYTGSVNLKSCTISENEALGTSSNTHTANNYPGAGGGIYIENTDVTVNVETSTNDVVVTENSALSGAGFYVLKGSVTIGHAEVSSNTSDGDGGGFYVNGGNVEITGGTFEGNKATTGNGGGFYSAGGMVNISNAEISGNHANSGFGGGLFSAAAVTVSNTTVSGNSASKGGGFYVNPDDDSAITTVENGSVISGNIATVNGGGAYIETGNLEVSTSTVKGNQANVTNGNGGGFYVGGGNLYLSSGTIGASGEPNKASKGGGFYMQGGEANITGGTVQYNEATNGGGLYMQGTDAEATANFTNGYFQYNYASEAGGGIYVAENSVLNMSQSSIIISNHVPAGHKGGGVVIDGGQFVIHITASSTLQVDHNYAGTAYSNDVRNNVYLEGENDYVTIDDSSVLGESLKVGISINGRDIPKKVFYCNNPEMLNNIAAKIKDALEGHGESALYDDAIRYEPYISDEYPFEANYLYFVRVWPVGITNEEVLEYANSGSIKYINEPKELAMFMMLSNSDYYGITYEGTLEGVITNDLDMSTGYWIPIGAYESQPFTGSLDGGGKVIYDLKSAGLINFNNYGLFGYTENAQIKDVILANCNLISGEARRMGALICETDGHTTVENCVASGVIDVSGSETYQIDGSCDEFYTVAGGLIGEAKGTAVIRNCISSVDIVALPKADESMYPRSQKMTVGGLVGKTSSGTLIENSFANPRIKHRCKTTLEYDMGGEGHENYQDNTDPARYVGGLVGYNEGRLENCYVRLERTVSGDLDLGETGTSLFGMFAGNNTGSISYCYAPDEDLFGVSRTYINNGTPASNYGEYNNVTCPYTYASYLIDNQAKMSNETLYGTTESTTLLAKLNRWVEDNNPTTGDDIYSNWMRTKSSPINGDYPILKYDNPTAPDYAVAGSKDGIMLEYGTSFNDILGRFNDYEEGTLFIYDKLMKQAETRDAADMESEIITVNNDENVKIYIDEDIPVLQSEDNVLKNVYTCQELKRTGLEDYWHNIATSLSGDKIGFIYGETGEVEWTEETNPCNVTLEDDGENTIFPTDAEISSIDLYCFYEPEYHWLNLKRNHLSHWHMNNPGTNIRYDEGDNNQKSGDTLIPGKGYLAAIDKDMLLQGNGTLNNGEIKVKVTTKAGDLNQEQGIPANEGTELRGYNLLGNPYQSYLSFAAFANNANNKELWNGTASYYVYDAENDQYLPGTTVTISRGSSAATDDINMHQGFFIVADNAGTAVFNNEMRSDNPNGEVQFRGEAPAYPLVNLMVKDAKGTGDVAVVEFDRPEYKAAPKMKNIGADGKIYFRYNDADQALLFLDEPTDQLPVHFDCQDGGTYTLTWSTANADFSYLHLIDNMTGMDIDMLTSDGYTFTANADDYKSRFKMVFAYTGIGENEDADTDAEHAEAFAFFSNGDLIVNGSGELSVMDVNGHVLYSTRLTDTQSRVSVPQVAAGIYLVRLNEKVQKIVIE